MAHKTKRRISTKDETAVKQVKARGVMERMRRKQKIFMVVLVCALLIPFGAYGILQQLVGRRTQVKGIVYGHEVSIQEFDTIRRRMAIARDIANRHQVSRFFPLPPVNEEGVWDRYIRLHEAEAMGLQVADQEVDRLLAMFFGNDKGQFDPARFQGYLASQSRLGLTEDLVRQAVADDLLVGGPMTAIRSMLLQYQRRQALGPEASLRWGPKLNRYLVAAVTVSDDEAYGYFLDSRRRYEVAYVALPAERFLADVPPLTDKEKRDWYDEHADRDPDESDDGAGYSRPDMCRLHYFAARVDDFKKTVTVPDEDVRAYYDANKDRYRDEGPATQPATRPTSRPTTGPATRPEADGPDTAPASRPTSEPAVRYRPFDDVKGEIREELVRQKAREAAAAAVRKAGSRRIQLERDHADDLSAINYAALARQYGMTYVKGTDLISAKQAMRLDDLKDARDAAQYSVDRIFFDRSGEGSWDEADMADMAGNAYHVWRTDRIKAMQLEYSEAAEEVAKDLRLHKAYDLAADRAAVLARELERLADDTAPVLALAARHDDLTAETTDDFTLDVGDWAPRRFGPDDDDTTAREVVRGIFARRIKDEDLQPGQVTVVGDILSRTQYVMRVTDRIDPGEHEFQFLRETYRQMALQAKRQALFKAWLEDAKKRANVQQPEKEEGAAPDANGG